jgi:alpha-mannosidase
VGGDNVVVTYIKPAADHEGIIVRPVNLGDKPTVAHLATPGRPLRKAWRCGTLEESRSELAVSAGTAACELAPHQLVTIRLLP